MYGYNLKNKKRQMKAMKSELLMYKQQVIEYRSDLENVRKNSFLFLFHFTIMDVLLKSQSIYADIYCEITYIYFFFIRFKIQ